MSAFRQWLLLFEAFGWALAAFVVMGLAIYAMTKITSPESALTPFGVLAFAKCCGDWSKERLDTYRQRVTDARNPTARPAPRFRD